MTHLHLAAELPGIDAAAFGLDAVIDAEGRFYGLVSNALPPGFRTTPTLSPGAAAGKAFPGETAVETTLSIVELDGRGATLVYSVSFADELAWVDAHDGTILLTTARARGATVSALSARHATTMDRHRVPGHTLPIEVLGDEPPYTLVRPGTPFVRARIEVGSFLGFAGSDAKSPPIVSKPFESFTPELWDVATASPLGLRPADASAVDAAYNVAAADAYLRSVTAPRSLGDDVVRVAVHRNFRTGKDLASHNIDTDFALYSPSDKTIYFGDGGSGFTAEELDHLPMSVALDIVVHEMTHRLLDSSPLTYEQLAFEEGLGDVMGQLAEHAKAPGGRPDRFGEAAFVGGGGLRNLGHPEIRLPGTNTSPTREPSSHGRVAQRPRFPPTGKLAAATTPTLTSRAMLGTS